MISDEDVKQLFLNGQRILARNPVRSKKLHTQFFRGIGEHNWENQPPGGCKRHKMVFEKFNIIPKYCFSCYKVLIEPRTVMELFKLMMVFHKLALADDNTRKCIVETREQVSGAYKAFIYCRGLEEAGAVIKIIKSVVSEEINEEIPVTLKRGCSEYALVYPEYAQAGKGASIMEYIEAWQEYEDLADEQLVINTQSPVNVTNNHPGYTSQEVVIMLTWLKYAATIGDLTYLKISGRAVRPIHGLKRPSPFHPVEGIQ